MSTTTTEPAKDVVQNCGSCGHWFCPLQNRKINVGQCRQAPPVASFSWPRTREHEFCAQWKAKDNLAKDTAPGATAAGVTPEPVETTGTDGLGVPPAVTGKGSPPTKPAPGSPAGGPPSLLNRMLRRGHGGARGQQ